MRYFLLSLACLLISSSVKAQTTIFSNVAYVDVEQGRMISKATVVVEGNTITQVTRRKVNAPEGATVIDGTGKYLIPGLVDSHIHMFQSGGLYARPDVISLPDVQPYPKEIQEVRDRAGDYFKRYLALGVTTVMDVGGPMANFDIRDEFAGSPLAPVYYTTGPLISSYQPQAFDIADPPIDLIETPEAARAMVQQQVPRNPDFIKIWYIVRRGQDPKDYLPVVEATMEEAAKHGIPVAVHATGLEEAKLAVKAGAKFLVHSVDDAIDQEFIDLLLENEVVLCPTLIVGRKYAVTFAQAYEEITRSDFLWANPFVLGTVFDVPIALSEEQKEGYGGYGTGQLAEGGPVEQEEAQHAENLRRLVAAGVKIATGTDAGNIGTQHASSMHEEMQKMAEAGLTPMQILQASTYYPAFVVSEQATWGSIAEGKQANLVLLNADPTVGVEALQEIEFVMRKGTLIDPDTLLPDTPEMLAQRQLNAYNAGNLEAFLEPYADTVKIFDVPGAEPSMVGKETMRERYGQLFERAPDLHCELVDRMVIDDTVIDQESISIPGRQLGKAIAIYRVAHGKIVEVYFYRPNPLE